MTATSRACRRCWRSGYGSRSRPRPPRSGGRARRRCRSPRAPPAGRRNARDRPEPYSMSFHPFPVSHRIPFDLMTPYKSGAGNDPGPMIVITRRLGNRRDLARVILRLPRRTLVSLVRSVLVLYERAGACARRGSRRGDIGRRGRAGSQRPGDRGADDATRQQRARYRGADENPSDWVHFVHLLLRGNGASMEADAFRNHDKTWALLRTWLVGWNQWLSKRRRKR